MGTPLAERQTLAVRVGSVTVTLEWAQSRGVDCHGGGQFELDVAPRAYNHATLPATLPRSPLGPPTDHVGFGW